jgi:hypothetical protein
LDCDVDLDDFGLSAVNLTGPLCSPEVCDDGRDNDCDGLTDCEDPACDGQPCGDYGLVCIGSLCQCPGDVDICDNSDDDDCDGLADCQDDADCPAGTPCGTEHYMCTPAGDCACEPPSSDCDSSYENGCETDTNSNPSNCGECGYVCNLPHAYPGCAYGWCFIENCWSGWCDENWVASDGCEFDLDTNPTCSGAIDLGAISGDTGDELVTQWDHGEQWFVIHVAEVDQTLFLINLGVIVELQPGFGTDYDLFVYCDDCVTLAGWSENWGEARESVQVGWPDIFGYPDERDLYILVSHWAANTCTHYQLRVLGNRPGAFNRGS